MAPHRSAGPPALSLKPLEDKGHPQAAAQRWALQAERGGAWAGGVQTRDQRAGHGHGHAGSMPSTSLAVAHLKKVAILSQVETGTVRQSGQEEERTPARATPGAKDRGLAGPQWVLSEPRCWEQQQPRPGQLA